MNCPKCQAPNPDGSRFCHRCGMQLPTAPAAPPPPAQGYAPPPPTGSGNYQPTGATPPQGSYTPQSPYAPQPPQQPAQGQPQTPQASGGYTPPPPPQQPQQPPQQFYQAQTPPPSGGYVPPPSPPPPGPGYAQTPPPPPGGQPLPPPDPGAQQKIQGPAIGLMVVGGLGALMSLFGFISSRNPFSHMPPEMISNLPPAAYRAMEFSGGGFAHVLGLAMSALVFFGAWQMRELRQYPLALIAAIVAMIPCLSPCCCIGLPIGIWALMVMMKPEVKSAFRP